MSRDLVMSQKAWEYWMHCMLSYECFLYHQPVIQWVRTWKMQLTHVWQFNWHKLLDTFTKSLHACLFHATTTATATKTPLKKWICTASNFIALIPSRLVRVWSWNLKDCIKVQKKKKKVVVFCSPSSTKREIRQFHVVVVQRRQRNVQKKHDARAKLLFCLSKPIFFLPFSLPSSSSLRKLRIVPQSFVCGGGRARTCSHHHHTLQQDAHKCDRFWFIVTFFRTDLIQ